LAVREWDLLASPAANLQPLGHIQAMYAFVIGLFASLAQFEMDHAGTIAPMAVRQGDDPRPKILITVRGRRVPEGRRTHAQHG
jgi:hypothetical protein